MSFQNLVRLSQMKKKSLPDYFPLRQSMIFTTSFFFFFCWRQYDNELSKKCQLYLFTHTVAT
jgi:hypothetical protein